MRRRETRLSHPHPEDEEKWLLSSLPGRRRAGPEKKVFWSNSENIIVGEAHYFWGFYPLIHFGLKSWELGQHK